MTDPVAPSFPPEVFETTGPETFADRFYVIAGPSLARLAFGCARPDGTVRYDTAVRITVDMVDSMIDVLTRLKQQVAVMNMTPASSEHDRPH
jgi:hypothetical protein